MTLSLLQTSAVRYYRSLYSSQHCFLNELSWCVVQLVLFSSHLVLGFENQFPCLLFRDASCVSDVVGVCYKTLMFGKKLVSRELSALELRKCCCELCASSNAYIYRGLHVSMCARTHIFMPCRLIPNICFLKS